MSAENVELARRLHQVFDADPLDPWLAFFAPEIEWISREDEPDADIYHGRAGIEQLALRWRAAFDNLTFEPSDFIDKGEHVIVPGRMRGRARASGIEIDAVYVWLYRFRDDKIVHTHAFSNLEDAINALH